VPWAGQWELLIDSDSPAWGGSGFSGYSLEGTQFAADADIPWQGQPASIVVDLPPLSVVWLGSRRP
jgi:1,4-alpha-glucan branching enzyme